MNNKKEKMPTKSANVQRGDVGTKASRKNKKENEQLNMQLEEAKIALRKARIEGQAMTNIVNTCKLLKKFHDLKQKGLVNELLMRQMLALGFTAEDLLRNYTEEELKTNIQKRGQVGGSEAGCSDQAKNRRGKKRGRKMVDSGEEEDENSSKE